MQTNQLGYTLTIMSWSGRSDFIYSTTPITLSCASDLEITIILPNTIITHAHSTMSTEEQFQANPERRRERIRQRAGRTGEKRKPTDDANSSERK